MIRLAGALACALLTACGGTSAGDRRPTPGPSLESAAAWDLVYEQVVGGNRDLYALPAGGGLPRRLTEHAASDSLPRFTPDGGRVVFTSERAGNWQLWEVPASGGPARRLRSNAHTEWQADVASDGRLAFLSNQQGAEQLWVVDPAGAERVLVRHGADTVMGNPHWSPDGRQIVFSSNWRVGHHIYVVDVATGESRRITELRAGGCEPRFHPDGKRIVYVRRGLASSTSRLVEIELTTGKATTLVDWPGLSYDPVYSPDGREIAFASTVSGSWAIYRQRLVDGRSWQVSPAGGEARYPDYRRR